MTMIIKCDCGGSLRPAMLENFDLRPELGISAVAKKIHGYRCDKCGWETIDGKEMVIAASQAAALIIALPQRLSREYAHYLRKYLEFTQKELAQRMGITRKTVSEWEGKGGRISPQHDLILRSLVYAKLSAADRPPTALRELAQAINHVRTAAPRAKLPPLAVASLDEVA